MNRLFVAFAASAGLWLPVPGFAQAAPRAISGLASSARHCISADGANVHDIGWIAANTSYTVAFESDSPLKTAVGRLNLSQVGYAVAYSGGNIARTAVTAGTTALYVSASGQPACYRYKVEIRPPGSLTAPAPIEALASPGQTRTVAAPSPVSIVPAAIVGSPSSATYCIAGSDAISHVHSIGRVAAGVRVALTFTADFDAIAGVLLVDPVAEQGSAWTNDNGGGGVVPALTVMIPQAGALTLFVGGVNGAAGCYRYKVDIR